MERRDKIREQHAIKIKQINMYRPATSPVLRNILSNSPRLYLQAERFAAERLKSVRSTKSTRTWLILRAAPLCGWFYKCDVVFLSHGVKETERGVRVWASDKTIDKCGTRLVSQSGIFCYYYGTLYMRNYNPCVTLSPHL